MLKKSHGNRDGLWCVRTSTSRKQFRFSSLENIDRKRGG